MPLLKHFTENIDHLVCSTNQPVSQSTASVNSVPALYLWQKIIKKSFELKLNRSLFIKKIRISWWHIEH